MNVHGLYSNVMHDLYGSGTDIDVLAWLKRVFWYNTTCILTCELAIVPLVMATSKKWMILLLRMAYLDVYKDVCTELDRL